MPRGTRITFTIDDDIYQWAKERAARRKISVSEQIRWLTRDGLVHRLELEREYRRLAAEATSHGR